MKSEHTHNPTTILVKEDGNVDFLASLVNLVKDDNPFTNTPGTGDTMVLGVTDEAYRRREQAHHRLLDEQGFPAEVEPEQNRYIPTAEIELDEDGKPMNVKPPWVVNEAGQDLGTSYAHEALSKPSAKDINSKAYNLHKAAAGTRKPNSGERKVFETAVARFTKTLGLSGQSKKAQDNVQYAMFDDQRESSRPTQPRRKQVTTGDSAIPVLIRFTKEGATGEYDLENIERAMASKVKGKLKKSDDCGCS